MLNALRVARHTERLDEIVAFYRDGLGLEEIGGFRDHQGYDGVFLALPGTGAHLEFTAGGGRERPRRMPSHCWSFTSATTGRWKKSSPGSVPSPSLPRIHTGPSTASRSRIRTAFASCWCPSGGFKWSSTQARAELRPLFALIRDGAFEETTDTVRVITGREPRSFAAFARDHSAIFAPLDNRAPTAGAA